MRKNTAALIDGKSLMSENELSQLTLDNLYHAIFYTKYDSNHLSAGFNKLPNRYSTSPAYLFYSMPHLTMT